MDRVGIVMPAYNAQATLEATVARIPVTALEECGVSVTLYLVDDGSTDGTARVVRRVAARCPFPVVPLAHPTNRGYGAAQKTGLEASLNHKNGCHVILHADGQYAPEELGTLLQPLLVGRADVVIGSKFLRGKVLRQGMPVSRAVGIRLCDLVENRILGLRGLEFHSGYMAYTSKALRDIPFHTLTDRFHFDGEMVLSAAHGGLRIEKVPISTWYGAGTSSLRVLPYLKELVETARKYRRGEYWFQRGADFPPASHRPGGAGA